MKRSIIVVMMALLLLGGCAAEFEIASSDVPKAVLDSFNGKYPGATDVEWEAEKVDGKLYFRSGV